ncbi:hypothetical protein B0H11DRAFT_2289873, partial [Mycena galericulata]
LCLFPPPPSSPCRPLLQWIALPLHLFSPERTSRARHLSAVHPRPSNQAAVKRPRLFRLHQESSQWIGALNDHISSSPLQVSIPSCYTPSPRARAAFYAFPCSSVTPASRLPGITFPHRYLRVLASRSAPAPPLRPRLRPRPHSRVLRSRARVPFCTSLQGTLYPSTLQL